MLTFPSINKLFGVIRKYGCLTGHHLIDDADKKKIFAFDVDLDSLKIHCKSCSEPLVVTPIGTTNGKSVKIEEEREGWWYNPDTGEDKKLTRPSFRHYDPRVVQINYLYKKLAKYNAKIESIRLVKPTYDELSDLSDGIVRLLYSYSLVNRKASIEF